MLSSVVTARVRLAAPALVVLLALGLRLWGITWAVPDSDRFFSYHPDETVVVRASLRVDPLRGDLDPGFYNYGSLALLTNSLLLHLAERAGMATIGPVPEAPSAGALLVARGVTAALGAATCWFLFGTGRLLFGAGAGLAAALLYAVAPIAVQHGHFATVDVPATFWLSGALFFAARYLALQPTRPQDLFWAGLWSGLAAATKYNAGIVLLAGAAAWWLRRTSKGDGASLLLGALLGFLIGCPGLLLNREELLSGILYETRHVRQGHGLVFVDTPPGLIYHVVHNLRWGLGAPLLLLTIGACGYALLRRRPADIMLLSFALPYYLLIGLAEVKFARYTLPLLPPLLLLAGSLLSRPTPGAIRSAAAGAGIVAAAYACLFSVALDRTMTRRDPRDRAAAFLRAANLPSVGFAVGPWFNAPPLHPLLADPNPASAKQATAFTDNPRLLPAEIEWDTRSLKRDRPAAVALSEFDYADALRVRDAPARAFLAALASRYGQVRVFANPVQVFGFPFTKLSGDNRLPTQGLPHDMLYTNPTTVIWYDEKPRTHSRRPGF